MSKVLVCALAMTFFSHSLVRAAFEPEGILGLGVRAMGMGGALTGLADDPSVASWNPAGILRISQTSAGFGIERQLSGIEFQQASLYSSLVLPLGEEALAISASYLRIPDQGWEAIPRLAVASSPGKDWALGLGLRGYLGSFPGPGGSRIKPRGLGLDLGIHRILSFLSLGGKPLRAGASVVNLGGQYLVGQALRVERVPWQARLGLGWSQGTGGLSVAVDFTFRRDPRSGKLRPLGHAGVERWFLGRRVATRLGVSGFQAGREEYSAGFGVHVGNFDINYAYLSTVGDLGANHRMGVALRPRPVAARIAFQPELFSPNQDGRKDRTTLRIRMENPYSVLSHRVVIRDRAQHVVWIKEGQLSPPRVLTWDGHDKDGQVVPDGLYTAEILAETSEGEVVALSRPVRLDTVAPRVNLGLSPAYLQPGLPLTHWTSSTVEEFGYEQWILEIHDKRLKLRGRKSGKGAPPPLSQWDGSTLGPGDSYSVRLKVRDLAGNEGVSPAADLAVIGERPPLLVLVNELLRRGITMNVTSGDVLFRTGSARIRVEGESSLLKVAKLLKEYPEIVAVVEGHTDNVPILSERFPNNQKLSEGRAREVANYLIEKLGIARDRVSSVGYADTQPVASNDTEEGKRQNRRIDVLLKMRRDSLKDINE